jgi:hypothetical protein
MFSVLSTKKHEENIHQENLKIHLRGKNISVNNRSKTLFRLPTLLNFINDF